MTSLKPITRSPFRIFLGKKYYRLKRYKEWYFGGKKYALKILSEQLPYVVFTHATPLLRDLKDVDMWLQHNKVKNIRIASKTINGVMVSPGETFSYWRLIGNTTKKKGYVDGMILFYGKVTTGTGGGLCQLSNLIYWMTLHTPLTITERYRHSFDVFPDSKRSQPFGSGATCAYNYLDLQIKNETKQAYQLVLYLTDSHLVGEWRATAPPTRTYEVYEKEHWITHEFMGGYVRHNKIYRKAYNLNQELIDDEFITENDAIMMYEPFLPEGNT
ncbi:VanW family protein [Ammoniphilus sp. CFH 90114]|uniref:VanW family protein n=1 Tax=Ammoniphilus sp. CFH 90114 TaxID=2493665 RepID=UPI00100EA032|nr:VanW family protein [Ammoniphilus sp. CFH 90114]RXT06568.1 vancomycin resistance protein [Ammoniphilus sp. CFH 90114]